MGQGRPSPMDMDEVMGNLPMGGQKCLAPKWHQQGYFGIAATLELHVTLVDGIIRLEGMQPIMRRPIESEA